MANLLEKGNHHRVTVDLHLSLGILPRRWRLGNLDLDPSSCGSRVDKKTRFRGETGFRVSIASG